MWTHNQELNESFLLAARYGDLAEATTKLNEGADILAKDDVGCYALCHSVECGHLPMTEYLLETGFKSRPDLVGFALILAESVEMVKLLARYNPDCTVTNEKGLSARDVMIRCGDYELVAAYDKCGLPKPPLNLKLLRFINQHCFLKRWSALTGIAVPAELHQQLDNTIRNYSHDLKRQKRLFRKITKEVSRSA